MSIEPNNKELSKAEALIDRLVLVDYARARENNIDLKLDLLERTIELIRIKKKHLVNNLSIEEFVQSDILSDTDQLRYSLPKKLHDLGSGTRPIQLQPKLLLFLLIYHKEEYRVIDIIRYFIDKIWDYLGTLDFKKTETGVIRCYTNTRFAARSLREYGLLRFGKDEAYKTWILSLPGFLVGSVVLEKYRDRWDIPTFDRTHKFPLHSDILDANDQMKHFDSFVEQLAKICRPDTDIFKTFNRVLEKAYKLLSEYWDILSNPKLSHKEMKKQTSSLIEEMDHMPDMDAFYMEFSKCLNLNRLLSEVE